MQKWWFSDRISHIAIWLLYFLLAWSYFSNTIPLYGIQISALRLFLFSLVNVLLATPVAYSAVYLYRNRQSGNKPVIGILFAFVVLTAASVLFAFVDSLFVPGPNPEWFFIPLHLFGRIPTFFVLSLIVNWLFIRSGYHREKNEKMELEKSKREAELNMLKAQISPHFLFNSLNNLNSLIHINPAEASALVVRISELLRYVIYEGKKETVQLRDEIVYLENYLALASMKKNSAGKISFSHQIETNHSVAPLIFINFFENAIKHGKLHDETDYLRIELFAGKNLIQFHCENTYGPNPAKEQTSGIGIENIRQRLHMLYPGKHSLSIHNEQFVFQVKLRIEQ